jgi:L-serine dehydratase
VNINHMEVSRSDKGKTALMVIETDTSVSADIVKLIARQPLIRKVIILDI